MCKEYNGYTNYETWAVSLWIDNDEGIYNEIKDLAISTWEDSDDTNNYNIFISKEDNASNDLEDLIKDLINEYNPLAYESSLYSDLLTASLSSVNWREIAENWIETIKENENV